MDAKNDYFLCKLVIWASFCESGEQHVVALPHRAVTDGQGDVALAGAARPGDQ